MAEPLPPTDAVEWLLSSDEPAVRYLTRRDLLDRPAEQDEREILDGPMVTALLSGQRSDGGFDGGGNWTGPPWRLVSLVELGVPSGEPRALASAEYVLGRILRKPQHRGRPTVIDGLHRVCANYEGTVLVFGSRLGLATDPRVQTIAERLIEWQWPDGGWNCHRNASGRRSSFHESLVTAWGLHEFARATGEPAAAESAARTAELFLAHRLFHSLGTGIPSRFRPNPPPAGEVINKRWLKLGYPSYWHYDIMGVLLFLSRVGRLDDPRAQDAVDLLEQRRRGDGLWCADRQWWTPPESRFEHQHEVVDWGRAHQPGEMLTLNALRILRSARRLG